jgi:hypothetical protein
VKELLDAKIRRVRAKNYFAPEALFPADQFLNLGKLLSFIGLRCCFVSGFICYLIWLKNILPGALLTLGLLQRFETVITTPFSGRIDCASSSARFV